MQNETVPFAVWCSVRRWSGCLLVYVLMRPRTAACGCPYEFSSAAEYIMAFGLVCMRNLCEVEVFEPWCPALSMSISLSFLGKVCVRNSSTAAGASPVRSILVLPYVINSTIEAAFVSVISVPIGQSISNCTPSSENELGLSIVYTAAPSFSTSVATCFEMLVSLVGGGCITVSMVYRRNTGTSPPMWSASRCVITAMSMFRSLVGNISSNALSTGIPLPASINT